jgi:hypothetical protein
MDLHRALRVRAHARLPHPPPLQPAFIVTTPVGTPLTVALGRLGHDSPGSVAAVRNALAERVAENMLDALRAAHARGIGHGNIKFANVILAPPLPPVEGGDDGQATLTLAGVESRTAVLVDWGSAQRLGVASTLRSQQGLGADAIETLMAEQLDAERDAGFARDYIAYYYAPMRSVQEVPRRVPRLVVRPQWDLEGVAYAYAAVRGDSRDWWQLSGQRQAELPPWQPRVAPPDQLDPRRNYAAISARAAEETGLSTLGPRAWLRYVFLHDHPEALGDRGRRFLRHVRAGRAVYTLDIDEREDDALRAEPGGGAPLGAQAAPWDDE